MLMQCRFRACAWHLGPNWYCVAIDVLVFFHSKTTTNSVESINGGLTESPTQRGAQSAQFIAQSCRWPRVVVPMRLTAFVTSTCRPGEPDLARTHGTRFLE